MLSRRSVRIKVMQLLYSISRDEGLSKDQLIKEYWKRIEETYEMLLFNLFLIENIAKISAEDYEKRKGKHLPTEQDKLFLPLLWENDKIRSLAKNTKLHKVYQKVGFNAKVDQDHFRSIYSEFSKTETYTDAIGKTLNSDEILELLLELYRFCRGKELFNEMVEDHYANWESDKSLVVGSVKKILKQLPDVDDNFFESYYPEKEATKDYGEFLLLRTFGEDFVLLELIKPVLKNWDSERVAIIDMIILKMAVAELIFCTTIPPKVTLNEFVDVAKDYSTSKSKEFINGVLDKLLENLNEAGKIKKEGRGLID
ncbi:MAG: transcription antitermination protein NusB [Saprospiraceae bacterium]|nr:transcription antitermination protein NusB [Saprospiraceae bacterium]